MEKSVNQKSLTINMVSLQKTESSAVAKLKEREKEIKILIAITEAVSCNYDLEDVMRLVVKTVSVYFNSDSCFLYLVREKEKEVVLVASQNPKRAVVGKIKMKFGEGITGWVAKNNKTVAIGLGAYRDWRFKLFNSLPEDKFEAFLSVPMVFRGKLIGVINVQHKKKKSQSQAKLVFAETIARLMAGAIENARLISETNVLKEALETRKLLDRAKSLLMAKGELTEEEAHRLIVKKSMDKRKTTKEIAEAIILSSEIF